MAAYSLGIWDINAEVGRMLEDLTKQSMQQYMDSDSFKDFCVYGENLGQPRYREATAKFLSEIYGDQIDSSRIVATYGATFGFMMLMTHFFEKGDLIFNEDLSFRRMLITANDFGMKNVSVPLQNDGIDTDQLEWMLREHKQQSTHVITPQKPYWAMIYLISVAHNPTAVSYTDEKCRKVVELARKYGVLVVSDDVYNFFLYNGAKANRLVKFDDPSDVDYGIGHVVSNGSYSKIIFPSIRLGWLECSEWMTQQFDQRGDVLAGGGFNAFNQNLMTSILRNPSLKTFFKNMLQFYKDMLIMAIDFLDKHAPEGFNYNRPQCSFFIWAQLPKHLKSKDLNDRCKKHGVFFSEGTKFCFEKADDFSHCFRINTTNLSKEELLKHLRILCHEAKAMIGSNAL